VAQGSCSQDTQGDRQSVLGKCTSHSLGIPMRKEIRPEFLYKEKPWNIHEREAVQWVFLKNI
jgi:hypothetical protein